MLSNDSLPNPQSHLQNQVFNVGDLESPKLPKKL